MLRKAKHITQEEMASYLGTTKQTISKYEKGIVTNIPSDRIEAMAVLLDTTPEFILGWDEKEKSPGKDELTEGEKMLLDLFRMVPAEKQQLVLDMIRAALKMQQ